MIATGIKEERAMNELLAAEFLAKLDSLGKDRAHEYRTNDPYPSIHFDDFLPLDVAEAALRDFPDPKTLRWSEFADSNQAKLAFDTAEKLPGSIRDILYFFNSRPMIEFLEDLTGIQGLIPDPYFVGGGLHQIKRGGYLEVHVDFNRHTKMRLDRRLNLLLYLNQEWKEEYGGHFELWDQQMSGPVRKILPVFNRCAIFSTTPTSYHGHPTPLACPAGRTRKSIAIYYYSNGRPADEVREEHTTVFRENNASMFRMGNIKKAIRAVTPPILMDALSRNKRV